MRSGKGSHGLPTIKKLVEEEENWVKIEERVITSFLEYFNQQHSKEHFIPQIAEICLKAVLILIFYGMIFRYQRLDGIRIER